MASGSTGTRARGPAAGVAVVSAPGALAGIVSRALALRLAVGVGVGLTCGAVACAAFGGVAAGGAALQGPSSSR